MNGFKQLTFAAVIGIFALPLSAATVQLVPTVAEIEQGEQFTVDLVLSAADAPGNHPGAFQGFVTVGFSESLAQYNNFVFSSPAELFGPAPVGDAGQVTFGFDKALDVGVIGTFTFTATGSAGDVISLSVADLFPSVGTFANTQPTITPFTPEFVGADVSVVPIPAAVWLMLSGLAVIGGIARRKPGVA